MLLRGRTGRAQGSMRTGADHRHLERRTPDVEAWPLRRDGIIRHEHTPSAAELRGAVARFYRRRPNPGVVRSAGRLAGIPQSAL